MTPQEKAGETRHQRTEAQRRERIAAATELELIRKSLREVLESESATPAEKLESSKLLLKIAYQTGF